MKTLEISENLKKQLRGHIFKITHISGSNCHRVLKWYQTAVEKKHLLPSGST